jgi:hypothetical protein
MKRIVLYDDEEKIARGYVERLNELEEVSKGFEILALDNEAFRKELATLESRREGYRNKENLDTQSILDETSIFIIDYDLLKFSKSAYLPGESVAYLARCFSKCVLIIGINQFNRIGDNLFDLTLKGHPDSFCDLNIPGVQLCNPGLWSNKRTKYRPWHWPQLLDYVESCEKRIEEAKKHLNDSVVDALDLEGSLDFLSMPASDFLGTDPKKITFKKFAQESGRGLKPKDINLDEDVIARIAEARLAKWLERLVFPGQDVLVDAPHLVSRYPSLLKEDPKSRKSWNRTTCFVSAKDLPLDHKEIEQHRFKKECWLSRPAWFWPKLFSSSSITEVVTPWKREATRFLFCEDSSTFESRKNCREFRAGVDSVFVQRYVNSPLIDGVIYQPKAKLL